MSPLFFLNPLPVLISLSTLLGVLVHDTKIDQLTTTLLATPALVASYEGVSHALKMSDPHTHTERISLSEAVRNMANGSPRLQPRLSEEKRHLLQKNVMKGHHAFDNYYLPVVA